MINATVLNFPLQFSMEFKGVTVMESWLRVLGWIPLNYPVPSLQREHPNG